MSRYAIDIYEIYRTEINHLSHEYYILESSFQLLSVHLLWFVKLHLGSLLRNLGLGACFGYEIISSAEVF
jgi:hypothetical protein